MYARTLYLLAALVLLTGSLVGCESQAGTEDPPNIIFVFSDDHAAHAVSAYGSAINQTPNIDRLAEEGIIFRNAFVGNSICAPSRATLLTGQHSHLNGQLTNQETFDGEQTTYPKLLQEAGYQTAMIGKWHLRSEPTGYDHWDILPGQGAYYNPDFVTPDGEAQEEGYVTDVITDKVIEWLEEGRDRERPFMLNYHHKAPHRNWMPGPKHLELYKDEDLPEPATLFDDGSGRSSAAQEQEMSLLEDFSPAWDLKFPPQEVEDEWLAGQWERAYERMTEEQKEAWDEVYDARYEEYTAQDFEGDDDALLRWTYQRYIEDYLGTIASIDDNLGRLLDYLDESGLAENTVVIYSSDQGFFLGDHGWYDKRWMYEESLQMPLVVRWPDAIEAGSESEDMVQNIDFAPTLLDLAGAELPEKMQGRSLLPLLRGETPADWRESIYYHYYEYPQAHVVQRHYGVRTDRYKLIHYYEIDEWELFDLEEDPGELQSVYGESEYAEVIKELKAELERLREHYQVPEEDPVQR